MHSLMKFWEFRQPTGSWPFEEITERPELRKTTFSQPASCFMAKKEEIASEFMVQHVPGCETCGMSNANVQSDLK